MKPDYRGNIIMRDVDTDTKYLVYGKRCAESQYVFDVPHVTAEAVLDRQIRLGVTCPVVTPPREPTDEE
jgi:hypothetical protein